MLSGDFLIYRKFRFLKISKKHLFSEHMLDKRVLGDLVKPDKLIL